MRNELQKLLTQKPLLWTEHARLKMRQYGFSEARVKRVLRNPVRTEAGIAPRTVAVMTPANPALGKRSASPATGHASGRQSGLGSAAPANSADGFHAKKIKKSMKSEIWVMYADTKKARKIIAAWRYPGVSPVRQPPPFPEDLME